MSTLLATTSDRGLLDDTNTLSTSSEKVVDLGSNGQPSLLRSSWADDAIAATHLRVSFKNDWF